MSCKIVIVGGVAGGASAAAKARRVDEQAEIVVFEKGPYVSFANCGLPYYLGGAIHERASLLLQSPESFWRRFRVQVRVHHEVTRIDKEEKFVEVKNLATGEYFQERYDKLILAPGAGAVIPSLAGIHAENIFTVKTVPDSEAIKNFLGCHHPKGAVIAGAGFIGLETAEALKGLGVDVTIVELLPQVLPPFDPDMAAPVAHHLSEAGIHLILADGVKAFHGDPLVHEVELQSGRRIPTGLVILSIGVRPELKLAKEAGLMLGPAGGIAVNDHQQTSDPDIYAAGDAVEVLHLVTGQATRIPLAGPANKQGRVAGANAAGGNMTFPGALGTAIVECLGITAAKTGLSEREAQQAGIRAYVSLTHSPDHAAYYPGSELLHIKLIAEEGTERLLGAQIVGEKGVDKRIDVLATALSARLKVTDLETLDLAYAPQFSSAKDPVIIAGFVASNIARQEVATITCERLQSRLKNGDALQLVDVRTPAEFAEAHLPQARLIPLDELRSRLSELDARKETVVYCRIGFRGYLAARILRQHGFQNVLNVTGGLLSCQTPEAPAQALAAAASGNGFIQAGTLRTKLTEAGALELDVREPDEYRFEHIEGTQNVPLSQLMQRVSALPRGEDIYVMCRTGVRTLQAIQILTAAGLPHLHAVQGGLEAWKAAGYAVKRSRGPIPIMRQVQIAAGSLALIGGLIPGLQWIAIIIGAGLVFAGVTGTCGMALLLAKMPWNRIQSPQSAGTCGTRCG